MHLLCILQVISDNDFQWLVRWKMSWWWSHKGNPSTILLPNVVSLITLKVCNNTIFYLGHNIILWTLWPNLPTLFSSYEFHSIIICTFSLIKYFSFFGSKCSYIWPCLPSSHFLFLLRLFLKGLTNIFHETIEKSMPLET